VKRHLLRFSYLNRGTFRRRGTLTGWQITIFETVVTVLRQIVLSTSTRSLVSLLVPFSDIPVPPVAMRTMHRYAEVKAIEENRP
jgi:hypothetical protein